MPTVGGDGTYLLAAPGWTDLDPNDIGVFVPLWGLAEPNSAGWDLVDDLWAAALQLFSA